MSYLWNIMEIEDTLDNCVIDDIEFFFDGDYNLHPTILSLSHCRTRLELTVGEIRWFPENNYSKHLLSEAQRVLARYDGFFRQAKQELPWFSPNFESSPAVEVMEKLRRINESRNALEDI